MKTVLPQVEDIIALKRDRLAQRQAQTPMNALRALAGMQRRPEPVLSTVTDTVMIFGQITHSPLNYDPVTIALSYWKAGLDAVSMFTDDTVYEGSVNDLTLIARAVPVPTINLNYVFDEYQIVESRAAGASALTLYASLLDRNALRTLTSTTLRNRMTAIIDVTDAEELHNTLDFCPPAISLGKRNASGDLDVRWMHYLRSFVPACTRIVISTPLASLEEAKAVALMRPQAVFVEPQLIPSLETIRSIFAQN